MLSIEGIQHQKFGIPVLNAVRVQIPLTCAFFFDWRHELVNYSPCAAETTTRFQLNLSGRIINILLIVWTRSCRHVAAGGAGGPGGWRCESVG